MKLAFNFKSGERTMMSEEKTNKIIGSVNYLKLIKYLMGPKKIENSSFKILDTEIQVSDLNSIEVIF